MFSRSLNDWLLRRRRPPEGRESEPASRLERFEKAVVAQPVTAAKPGDIPFEGYVGVSVTQPNRMTAGTGLLLMIHGLGSDWDEHDKLAAEWSERYDMLCLQVRDRHAGERGMAVPMDFGKYQTIDCLRAVQWVLGRYDVDAKRIVVWGGSGGGHVTLQCALFAPDLFAAAISCCPYTHPTVEGEIVGEWQDGWIRRCIPEGAPPASEQAIRSPLVNVERLKTPVLLMHGSEDRVVHPLHSRRLAEAARAAGRPLRYREITGGDHNFYGGLDGLYSRKNATELLGNHLMISKSAQSVRIAATKPTEGWWVRPNRRDGLFELIREPASSHP